MFFGRVRFYLTVPPSNVTVFSTWGTCQTRQGGDISLTRNISFNVTSGCKVLVKSLQTTRCGQISERNHGWRFDGRFSAQVGDVFISSSVKRMDPIQNFFHFKPQPNFLQCRLHRITSMNDVTTHIDGEITTDGTRLGFQGVRLPQQHSTLSHNILPLPHHWYHRSRCDVFHQRREEGLGAQIRIMLVEEVGSSLHELHSHQFVATLFESLDDFGDEVSCDAVWLDHDERSFGCHGGGAG